MPLFVLQDSLCSVHAAGVFPGSGRRLCAVNVKLTMRLGTATGLLMSVHSDARRFSPRPARLLHRRRQTGLVVARGAVGMSPVFLAREDQHKRGRAFSELSFLFAHSADPAHVSRLCGAGCQTMLRIAGRTLHRVRDTRLILSPWKEFCRVESHGCKHQKGAGTGDRPSVSGAVIDEAYSRLIMA